LYYITLVGFNTTRPGTGGLLMMLSTCILSSIATNSLHFTLALHETNKYDDIMSR